MVALSINVATTIWGRLDAQNSHDGRTQRTLKTHVYENIHQNRITRAIDTIQNKFPQINRELSKNSVSTGHSPMQGREIW